MSLLLQLLSITGQPALSVDHQLPPLAKRQLPPEKTEPPTVHLQLLFFIAWGALSPSPEEIPGLHCRGHGLIAPSEPVHVLQVAHMATVFGVPSPTNQQSHGLVWHFKSFPLWGTPMRQRLCSRFDSSPRWGVPIRLEWGHFLPPYIPSPPASPTPGGGCQKTDPHTHTHTHTHTHSTIATRKWLCMESKAEIS